MENKKTWQLRDTRGSTYQKFKFMFYVKHLVPKFLCYFMSSISYAEFISSLISPNICEWVVNAVELVIAVVNLMFGSHNKRPVLL